MRSPCRDCGDRTVDCHGKCERYKNFQQECVVLREKDKAFYSRCGDVIYRSNTWGNLR